MKINKSHYIVECDDCSRSKSNSFVVKLKNKEINLCADCFKKLKELI